MSRRIRPQRRPFAFEKRYQNYLFGLIDEAVDVSGSLDSALSADPAPRDLIAIRNDIEGLASGFEGFTRKEFNEQIVSTLGAVPLMNVDTSATVSLFVQENMILVGTVPRSITESIKSIILRGTRAGTHARQIEKDIGTAVGLAKKRAKLIARDQVNKLSGDLTRQNHKAAGITKYQWMTSRDERVRSRHANLDGQIFSWDKPPIADKSGARYHPKQAVNCRCDAVPVINSH